MQYALGDRIVDRITVKRRWWQIWRPRTWQADRELACIDAGTALSAFVAPEDFDPVMSVKRQMEEE